MARQSAVRAVEPRRAPQRRSRPLTVSAAAKDGDRRKLLVALRSRIAQSVEDPKTPARDLAALSKRLLEIVREIELIDAEATVDDVGSAASTPDQKWTAA